MSAKFYGRCENCGKSNLRTTITVHIHETPGTLGSSEWCIECINKQGYQSKKNKRSWLRGWSILKANWS